LIVTLKKKEKKKTVHTAQKKIKIEDFKKSPTNDVYYTLRYLVMKIQFRNEISLLNSEKWATNLLRVGHISLFRNGFLLLKQFSRLTFLGSSTFYQRDIKYDGEISILVAIGIGLTTLAL